MAPELRAARTSPVSAAVEVAAHRHRRRAWLLFAAAGWNLYVWLTRLGLVLDGSQTVPFRLVHGVLIVVSLAFAVAFGVVGWRMFREARRSRDPTAR